MPATPTKQRPPIQAPPTHSPPIYFDGDILASGVSVNELEDDWIRLALYGRNRIGKTTLACEAPKRIALMAIEPSPTGGARSVMNFGPQVQVYRVAAYQLMDKKTGKLEPTWGSEKVVQITDSLRSHYLAGRRPFETIIVDGLTSWNDIILQEVLGVNYADMPGILSFGKVTQEQYGERAERMIRYLRAITSLPCHVILLAQEKDHNPPRDEKNRVLGNKMVRPMQEESFFSLDVGAGVATWVFNSCDFLGQLYQDAEYREEVTQDRIGDVVKENRTMVATGRIVRRLRTLYHPNYAAGFRSPNYKIVPDYIQAESPTQMFNELTKVIRGERTDCGYYPNP